MAKRFEMDVGVSNRPVYEVEKKTVRCRLLNMLLGKRRGFVIITPSECVHEVRFREITGKAET